MQDHICLKELASDLFFDAVYKILPMRLNYGQFISLVYRELALSFGHGILPTTPEDNARFFFETVKGLGS